MNGLRNTGNRNRVEEKGFAEKVRPLFFIVLLMIVIPGFVSAQDSPENPLVLVSGEIYIELTAGADGFDLYIKAKEGLGSVLITESSADPEKRLDSYAFRAWDYNPINGDEQRILNGEFLESERDLFFLLDSTPEPNHLLGEAFRVFIPYELTYGYPWSREGQVQVHRGTWLNVRTFALPYADYRGEWTDNPFVLSMEELPPPPEPEIFAEDQGPVGDIQEATERIVELLQTSGGNVDVVLVLDTTISMKDDVGFLQDSLVSLVRNRVANFDTYRVGIMAYRDYKEAYLTRKYEFVDNFDDLQRQLNALTVGGGRDLPEAVNEGFYAALTEFEWEAPERLIIQVGDAPAHPEPRGAITPEMVDGESARLGVSIVPIRLPDDSDSD